MRTENTLYTAEVRARTSVTPNMLRITLGAARTADGGAFASSGRADEFFGLRVPGTDGVDVQRYYSVRAWREDADEIDVDFVVHAHGPATSWARTATPGDRVSFDAPRGHYAPPPPTRRVVLVGDATALPAIGRILDERTSADPPVHAILSVDDPRDRQRLAFRDGDTERWVAATALLSEIAVATEDDTDGCYVWFSGEATTMRDVRRYLRHARGWPRERYTTMGYWRRDTERWEAAFSRQPDLEDRMAEIWASDEDDETQRDRIDELLMGHGL